MLSGSGVTMTTSFPNLIFSRHLALMVLCGLLLCCPAQTRADQPTPLELHFFAFGTEISLIVIHPDDQVVRQAGLRIEEQFAALHTELNPWQPGPLRSVNNALNLTGRARPGAATLELIAQSQLWHQRSLGKFNPTLGKLVARWQFDQAIHAPRHTPATGDSATSGTTTTPGTDTAASSATLSVTSAASSLSPEATDGAEPLPSPADLRLDPPWVYARRPGVYLDFGGIAKGYALDKGLATLQALGVEHAVINAGGDLKALGQGPHGAWHIGIRHPRGTEALAGIHVASGEGVFTSGDYERYFEQDGRRYHHIFDPDTGEPAIGIVSATVVDPSGALADAAATALIAAGPAQWQEVARSMGVRKVLVVTSDGTVFLSRDLVAQTTILDPAYRQVIVDLPPL